MKKLIVDAAHAVQGRIEVNLLSAIPTVFAQYIGALFSMTYNNRPTEYMVEKVVIGDGLDLGTKTAIGMYEYIDRKISIDVYKLALLTIKRIMVRTDPRAFTFSCMMEALAHEAIHAFNAATQPKKYGYGEYFFTKTDEQRHMDEEEAYGHMVELSHGAMDLFDISPTNDELEWLRPFLDKAAVELDTKVWYKDFTHQFVEGTRCYSFREYLIRSRKAEANPNGLLPLPPIYRDGEKPVEKQVSVAEGVVETQPTQVDIYDEDGFLKPEFIFEEEDIGNYGSYDPEEPFSSDGEGLSAQPQPQNPGIDTPPVQPIEPVEPFVDDFVPPEEKPLNMDNSLAAQLKQTAETIYKRCFNHIYKKCEWNGKGGFDNLGAVLEPVYIGDLLHKGILAEVHSADEYGRLKAYKNPGDYIKGFVAHKKKLPMYKIFLWDIHGNRHERRIVPQSTTVYKADGTLKWTSDKVTCGERLGWVMSTGENNKTIFVGKYREGWYTFMNHNKNEEEKNVPKAG